MVKFLSQRYAERNIFVNAVAPGLILTDQTETEFKSGAAKRLIEKTLLKRPGNLEDVLNPSVLKKNKIDEKKRRKMMEKKGLKNMKVHFFN